jgi:hypothetical protein
MVRNTRKISIKYDMVAINHPKINTTCGAWCHLYTTTIQWNSRNHWTTSVESLLHHYYHWTFTSFCFGQIKLGNIQPPQVVLIFGWFIATIGFFMNEDILMKYWSVFIFLRWRVYLGFFFMNEDILMKYWSVLLIFHSSFYIIVFPSFSNSCHNNTNFTWIILLD